MGKEQIERAKGGGKEMAGLDKRNLAERNLEKMRLRKRELHLTNKELAQRSGVPLGTVNKIFSGATRSPKYHTLLALERVLGMCFYYDEDGPYVSMVREKVQSYGIQGENTIEDYYALPKKVRAELIDGLFYYMAVPGRIHQEVLGELHYCIKDYIRKKGETCRVYMAPFEVRLDGDNKTVVQPDLCIVCRPELLDARGMEGAPDFVAEVISQYTGKREYTLKLRKYWNAGVKEYWVIDPFKRKIAAYQFQGEELKMNVYGFGDKVPVEIYGDLEIDFRHLGL